MHHLLGILKSIKPRMDKRSQMRKETEKPSKNIYFSFIHQSQNRIKAPGLNGDNCRLPDSLFFPSSHFSSSSATIASTFLHLFGSKGRSFDRLSQEEEEVSSTPTTTSTSSTSLSVGAVESVTSHKLSPLLTSLVFQHRINFLVCG